ncbi:hypothetical protein ACHAXN_007949 [Cyclotella atomus]
MASTGVSISVKPGAAMPLLPFKVNRTTERQRFSSNIMVGARLANNETGLPLVTPAQPRPTLQQQASVEGKASNVRFTPRPSMTFKATRTRLLIPLRSVTREVIPKVKVLYNRSMEYACTPESTALLSLTSNRTRKAFKMTVEMWGLNVV